MLKELQSIGRDAANAYLEGGRERALAEALAHQDKIRQLLETLYERAIDMVGGAMKFGMPKTRKKDFLGAVERLRQYFFNFALEESVLIAETSKNQVAQAIERSVEEFDNENDIAKQIQSKVSTISIGRARTIARTESLMATSESQDSLVRELDLPKMKKEWVARIDSRTRDGHEDADGQTVGMNDYFNVSGKRMRFAGDRAGGVENVANCRCSVVYIPDDEVF